MAVLAHTITYRPPGQGEASVWKELRCDPFLSRCSDVSSQWGLGTQPRRWGSLLPTLSRNLIWNVPHCPLCFFLSVHQMCLNVSYVFTTWTPTQDEARRGGDRTPSHHQEDRWWFRQQVGLASGHKPASLPPPAQVCPMSKTFKPWIIKEELCFL